MTILISIISFLILIVLWTIFVEPNWFKIRKIKVSLPKKVKKPITILHLSDSHFAKDAGIKKHFFQRLSMLNPDLIFVTGDTLENDEGIETAVRLLSGLRARYGTFLILGNHDYYDYRLKDVLLYHAGVSKISNYRNNTAKFISELKKIGVTVLVNQSVRLEVHGNSVFIGGTDDPLTQHVDFERIFHDMKPNSLNLLLAHGLDCLLKLSHHGLDFVFAGHTHGGQLRFPLLGPIFCDSKLPRKFIDGLHEYKGMKTFVSRGLGASRLTFPRLLCRPEAVWFELLP